MNPNRTNLAWILSFCFLILLVLGACGFISSNQPAQPTPTSKSSLMVFAAASLIDVFTELAKRYEEQKPGVEIMLNLAGSQQLVQQLSQGAPADIFASASPQYMQEAIQMGRVMSESERLLAQNKLVVIYPRDNPGKISSLKDLTRPGLKLVMADPAVPVGRYSVEFLTKAAQDPELGPGFMEQVQSNVVSYEENVRAVLSKVTLGEADAGIVYTTDLGAGEADPVSQLEIPAQLNVIAEYLIAPISDSQNTSQAGGFIDFILSPAGKEVLASYGFIVN